MIEVKHLSKFYGDFQGVRDLSFEIPQGHVYGFLGPNGAGKSTTMNMMTGCLSPTDGQILIDGFDILEDPAQAKKLIGYLPEQPPLYLQESVEEYLRFVAEAKGVKGPDRAGQLDDVLEKTRLSEVRHRQISALSKGYRQRVGIAQALLGNPRVIILDEPTVGLDPIQIIEIRDLIRDLGRDHTVILSSHILSEVQTLCEKILIISHGELVAFDSPEHLEAQMQCPEICLTTEAPQELACTLLTELEMEPSSVGRDPRGHVTLTVPTEGEDIYAAARAIFFAFARQEQAILELTLKKPTLEEIFLQLTEHDPGSEAPEQEATA